MPAKQLVVVGHGLCSGLVISGEQEGDHVLGLGETGDLPASMCTIVDAAAIHGDRFISSLLGVEGGLVAQPFPFVGGFVEEWKVHLGVCDDHRTALCTDTRGQP